MSDNPSLTDALLHDLIVKQEDIVSLAVRYELSPRQLAQWFADPHVQRIFASLCQLADYQTQILLSRYRIGAAGKLIDLASNGDGETLRKTCVDLLKIDLKRAVMEGVVEENQDEQAETFWQSCPSTTHPLRSQTCPTVSVADPQTHAADD